MGGAVCLVGLVIAQTIALKQIQQEVAALKQQLGTPAVTDTQPVVPSTEGTSRVVVERRVESGGKIAEMEARLAELTRTSDYLMERGQVPLAGRKASEVMQSLYDPNTSERDRLQALRLLRRNGMFTEEAATFAASLLSTTTDPRARRELLDQLEGVTNNVLKTAFMQIATTDADADVRERAVDRLGRFAMSDPQVEAQLWHSLRDPAEDVRDEAQEALRRLPMNDARLAEARQRGLSADASLAERFTAMRMLQNGKQDVADLAGALAQAAISTQDPRLRIQLLQGFDDVSHPSFMTPLVQALTDQSPEIRAQAADALSSFRTEPTVNQWLTHLSQNDVDPRVRREAIGALMEGRGRR